MTDKFSLGNRKDRGKATDKTYSDQEMEWNVSTNNNRAAGHGINADYA